MTTDARETEGASTSDTLRLQVVIPAYQAAGYLPGCLSALAAGGFDLADCILVDDGSTDATAEIAEAAGVQVIRQFPGKGASAARNLGAAKATAPIICFVDADVVVHPDMAPIILRHFADDPELDAVFGSYDDEPGHPGLVSQYRNLLHHYVHHNGAGRAGTFWTGFGAVKRAVFERLGGFDSSTENIEDVDFGMRLCGQGGKVILDPSILGKHLKHWTVSNMLKVDLFGRAVPWTRVILFRHGFGSDLNTSGAHRLNVVIVGLTGLALVGLLAAPGLWPLIPLLALAFVVLNGRFFGYLLSRAGAAVALASIPLHALHYGCAGLGFALVYLREYLPARLFGRGRGLEAD